MRLKLRPDTPQRYEDIHYRDITLDSPTGSIFQVRPWSQFFDLKGQPPPKSLVRNVTLSNVKGTYGTLGVIEGNPGQTEFGAVTLENIDVRLKDEEFKVVGVKDLKVSKVSVNGKPFSPKPAE